MGDPAKPFACRVRIGWMRVCGADNLRQKRERRIGQAILHDDGVERNAFAMVPKLATRYVIDDPFPNAFPVGVAREEHEFRIGIDELPDKPGGSDLSTFDFFPGDPFHAGPPFRQPAGSLYFRSFAFLPYWWSRKRV